MSETGWKLVAKAVVNPGLKICRKEWGKDLYVLFKSDGWVNKEGEECFPDFHLPNWQEYTEPTKERKTRVEKRYAPVFVDDNGDVHEIGRFLYAKIQPEWEAYTEINVHVFEEGENEPK